MLSCFMGRRFANEAVSILKEHSIPVYDFPEESALALAAMDRYRRRRERPEGKPVRFEVDLEGARAIVQRALDEGRDGLSPSEARALLTAYSIPTAEQRVVSQLGEAVEATKAIGFPVALKLAGEGTEHKTDMGGIALDLRDMDEVVNAWEKMQERFPGQSLVVQRMLKGGREVALGVVQDPSFGPLMMFGLGGIHVEYLKDVAFRIHPLTDLDAQDMVRSIRAYRLLQGVRGEEAVDEAFLVECILRMSQLVGDLPALEEMEINPFIISPARENSAAVDIRIHLRPPAGAEEGAK